MYSFSSQRYCYDPLYGQGLEYQPGHGQHPFYLLLGPSTTTQAPQGQGKIVLFGEAKEALHGCHFITALRHKHIMKFRNKNRYKERTKTCKTE